MGEREVDDSAEVRRSERERVMHLPDVALVRGEVAGEGELEQGHDG